LWVQEGLRRGDFKLFKIAAAQNPADLLTKHLPRETLHSHMKSMSMINVEGRAATAPQAKL
jgi:hypothetical protein